MQHTFPTVVTSACISKFNMVVVTSIKANLGMMLKLRGLEEMVNDSSLHREYHDTITHILRVPNTDNLIHVDYNFPTNHLDGGVSEIMGHIKFIAHV